MTVRRDTPREWGTSSEGGRWPYVLIRMTDGDIGVRPEAGPFWESPDLLVVPGDAATLDEAASTISPLPGELHTVFVRVWNMGRLPSPATVRAYVGSPSLAFDDEHGRDRLLQIGEAPVELADRGQPGHVMTVRAGTYIPAPLLGGSECVVAVVSTASDRTPDVFDASSNRHVAQRHVCRAGWESDLTPLVERLGASLPADAGVQVVFATEAHTSFVLASLGGTGVETPFLPAHLVRRGQEPPEPLRRRLHGSSEMPALGMGQALAVRLRAVLSVPDLKVSTIAYRAGASDARRVTLRLQCLRRGRLAGGYTIVGS